MLLLGAVLLLSAPLVVDAPRQTLGWRELFNAGHAPLFGCVALIVLGLVRGRGRFGGLPAAYVVAGIVAAGVGVAVELAQLPGPRDADAADILRNLAGIGAFLALRASVEPGLAASQAARSRRATGLRAVAGLLLLAVAVTPVRVFVLTHRRDAAFPVLLDSDAAWARTFTRPSAAWLDFPPAGPAWPERGSRGVARLRWDRASFPGLSMIEPAADWTGHERLVLKLFWPGEEAGMLALRVEDLDHDGTYADRFNRTFRVAPGPNVVTFDLEEIRRGPGRREVDLRRIGGFTVFADRPGRPGEFRLASVRLE